MHPYMIQLLTQEKQRDLLRQAAHRGSASRASGSGLDRWNWHRWRCRRAEKVAQIVDLRCSDIRDEPDVVDSAGRAVGRRFKSLPLPIARRTILDRGAQADLATYSKSDPTALQGRPDNPAS